MTFLLLPLCTSVHGKYFAIMLPSYVFIYKHREKVPNFIISQLLKYFVLEFRHLHISFPS